jgi:hypothetical protein
MNSIRARAIAAAGVLGVATIALSWIQPASAHLGSPEHLWKAHLEPLADARYLQDTHVFVSREFTLGIAADLVATRRCPTGTQALGGGVDFDASNADVQVISSAPLVGGVTLFTASTGKGAPGDGWRVTMHNDGVLAVTGRVGVICSR